MIKWQRLAIVAEGNKFYWDEMVGSSTPPIKTRKGWGLYLPRNCNALCANLSNGCYAGRFK